MRKLILLLSIAVSVYLVPLGFRFSPSKTYFVLCLIVAILVWRPCHRYLIRYWSEHTELRRATKINGANVAFQATAMSAAVFFLSCFVAGLFFTMEFGATSVAHGKVVSSHSSRRCTNLAIQTQKNGFVRVCTRSPLGAGSFATVRIRHSILGHYVE